jgi:hypothetical protein
MKNTEILSHCHILVYAMAIVVVNVISLVALTLPQPGLIIPSEKGHEGA